MTKMSIKEFEQTVEYAEFAEQFPEIIEDAEIKAAAMAILEDVITDDAWTAAQIEEYDAMMAEKVEGILTDRDYDMLD
jgi:predicted transcriptional regulator